MVVDGEGIFVITLTDTTLMAWENKLTWLYGKVKVRLGTNCDNLLFLWCIFLHERVFPSVQELNGLHVAVTDELI